MKQSGFTLVELLIAICIFAVLATLAYGGYNTSVKQASAARASMARLQALQTTVRLLTQDFEQLAPRGVRDVLGDSRLPAVQSATGDAVAAVTLTRMGWSNPAGVQRSTLQRVSYVLKDGVLWREHSPVLDAVLNGGTVRRELINDVVGIKLRYMNRNRQWKDQWPPPDQGFADVNSARPMAVEITLELKDFGEIVRLIEVPG